MPRKIRVAIETLGCKLNQAESETLARQFVSAGCRIVGADEMADVYILNTCTVTHIADRKARQSLRAARRRNPQALVVATGCYVERSAEDMRGLAELDVVVKNEDKGRLPEIFAERLNLCESTNREEQHSHPESARLRRNEGSGRHISPYLGESSLERETALRTRAFIKAQDGCNRRCAYCIVPLVRGREKSLPADEVISEIAARVAEGYKEVVLTGTEIGSYSSEGLDIKGLLERILDETRVERLRISSLQPCEITTGLLSLWKNPRLCPHFHISLQSGSDRVLESMKRGYCVSGYAKAVSMIREVLPHAAITTDIIVGFPGETDDEFQETVDFCRRMGFVRIHVFPFPRPGTVAADMLGQIEARIKKERSAKMLALTKESAREFISRFVGGTFEVLWEQQSNSGIWSGYTADYIRVYARSERDMTNILTAARLLKLYRDGVWGEISQPGGE